MAELEMGRWPPLGSSSMAAAVLGHRLVELAPGLPAHAEVVVGTCAPLGSSSMARRNSAIASSSWPLSCQHMPSWWWAGGPWGRVRWRGGTRPSPRRAGPWPASTCRARGGPGRLGVEFDGAAEFGHRLVELALVLQAQAELVVVRAHLRASSMALRPARIASSTWPWRNRATLTRSGPRPPSAASPGRPGRSPPPPPASAPAAPRPARS